MFFYSREAHKEFYRQHKELFRLCDCVCVFALFLNFGAVMLTNYMVTREKPLSQIEFNEVNPVAARAEGYKVHPESDAIMRALVSRFLIWGLIVFFYFLVRFAAYNYIGLVTLCTITTMWFMMFGYDFFNNFGFWLGLVLR